MATPVGRFVNLLRETLNPWLSLASSCLPFLFSVLQPEHSDISEDEEEEEEESEEEELPAFKPAKKKRIN